MTFVPKPAAAKRQRDEILKLAPTLRPAQSAKKDQPAPPDYIDTFIRRAQQTTVGDDGYPRDLMSDSHAGGVSDPTMATIERIAGGRIINEGQPDEQATPDNWTTDPDPVLEAIGEFFECIASARRMVWRAAKLKSYIEANPINGRQSSVADCLACETAVTGIDGDKLRAGYCNACYQAWTRTTGPDGTGRQDRRQFERARRERLAS